jgi:hypothetical protein
MAACNTGNPMMATMVVVIATVLCSASFQRCPSGYPFFEMKQRSTEGGFVDRTNS